MDLVSKTNKSITGATFRQDLFGTCLKFTHDTTNQVLVQNGFLLGGKTNLTIVSRVKLASTGVNQGTLYSERAASGNDILKFETNGSAGKMYLTFRDDAGTLNQPTANTSLNDLGWHLVGMTKSGTSVVFYYDGRRDGTTTLTATDTFTNANPSCLMGKDVTATNETFDGLTNDLMLWTRTLSDTEFQQLYTSPNQLYRHSAVSAMNTGIR